ncbi:DUF6090 family protein [Robiginitalea sp.]|uniref:DUF6090 family protein n=1 Tax=Robiginitalea sp. TaxID=1902411 RepID=UPI003C4B12F6
MLPDNKFSKYLLYAIGEILLVVIGILIALQVSNWNENMQEEKAIHKVLIEIKEDLIHDKAELKLSLEVHSKDLEAQNRVIKALENKTGFNEKMRSDLGHIYLSHYFFSVSKGYNLLKEINLTSLKNKELRISLTRYYENDIPRVHLEFADDKMEFENYWLPYVRIHFKEWEFGEYAVPHDYDQIVNDRELLTATKRNSINLRNTVNALEAALDSAIKLIELLPDDSIMEMK